MGVASSSVYLFNSGLPQPADFVLLGFALLTYLHALGRYNIFPGKLMPISWSLMVLWVSLVVLFWSIWLFSEHFLRDALFWIYNYIIASALLYAIVADIISFDEIKKYIQIALIISGIGVILSIGVSVRTTGFFNNPNQLAFYSLCALSINQVLNRGYISFKPISFVAFVGGAIGIFAAASMAAIAGFFALLLAHLIASRNFILMFKSFLGIGVVTLLLMTTNLPYISEISSIVQYRFEHAEQRDKFSGISEERNYDRIFAFPEYTVLGAGEAHLERFYPYNENEIHSSFGNMLFAYGVIGLGLFLILILQSIIRSPLEVWFVMSAPLLYSITHMGLRTTLFWVFILVVWAFYNLKAEKNAY
ncbi:hypothetical protein [Thiomicrorhabdus sp. 6S3-12]|uniref:hypothetical protein n=1 Tax=Thiomicrorhabdus sp. 6S3-12 TaxID=2819681 RepID=UPI001AAD1F21|nr:hypothetical protein [Thiomicrorhabdus sp. 6S3-12]MBO1922987.1 hypothetical protein [Thiomicrorhabdus sp. 6S3-12]